MEETEAQRKIKRRGEHKVGKPRGEKHRGIRGKETR
jgi:hypothetical protein